MFLRTAQMSVFGGLIASYVVMRLGSSGWGEASSHLNFNVALINTLLLLTSSMTIVMAHAATHDNNFKSVANFLALTILLGTAFLTMKAFEYAAEMNHGFLPSSGIFWSFYYGMTGLHALHVLAGIVVNIVLWIQALKGTLRFNPHRVELLLAPGRHHLDIYFSAALSRLNGVSREHRREPSLSHYLVVADRFGRAFGRLFLVSA